MAKSKLTFLPTAKTSWLVLTLLFVFDNTVSYWAVVYKNGKEANFLIAPLVEKFPLLYFLCIPLEIIMIYVFLVVIRKILLRVFTKSGFKSSDVTRVILASMAIYWAIGVSSANLFFLLGHRMTIHTIGVVMVGGFLIGILYFFLLFCKIRPNNLQ